MNNHAPVFVIGVHRSGTSLLNLMLDGSSTLWIPYESHFIVKLHKMGLTEKDFGTHAFRRGLVESILGDEYVRGWEVSVCADDVDLSRCTDLASTVNAVYSAHAARAGKQRWGDKTPSYVMHADRLNELFPHCLFVHIVRDGRDVARSVVKRDWGPNDFVSALRGWARKVELAEKMLGMLAPSRRMTLRFEDLVASPEQELGRVCDFLGIPFEGAMLDYPARAEGKVGGRAAAHHSHLKEPLRTDLTSRWKRGLSSVDQAIAHEVAGEMLAWFGYEPGRRNHPFKELGKLRHRVHERRGWRRGECR